MVGGASLRGKNWSLVLDVLGFRGLSDSQVGGIMEMATCVCMCVCVYGVQGRCASWNYKFERAQ